MSFKSYYDNDDASATVVGHRGFKAKYTENTLQGFQKCFESGATSLETDLWLTRDQVLIISHDVSTKRIFVDQQGNPTDYNILETDYHGTLEHLQTAESGERLLTFKDLLRWFRQFEKTWTGSVDLPPLKLMLDIKRANPTKLIKYLVKDLLSVHDDLAWWLPHIQFGIWDLSFIKYINQDDFFQHQFAKLPANSQFDVIHISFNWRDSLHYLRYNAYLDRSPNTAGRLRFKVTGVSLLYLSTWSIGFLTTFVPLLKSQDLSLYSWTINTYHQFDYLLNVGRIAGLREFGVVTDHPDLMAQHMQDQLSPSSLSVSSSTDGSLRDVSNNSSQEDLATELTKLTTSHDSWVEKRTIHLTWEQKLSHFLFAMFQKVSTKKTVTEEELQFDATVDENLKRTFQSNKIFSWVFSTCQKYGVF